MLRLPNSILDYLSKIHRNNIRGTYSFKFQIYWPAFTLVTCIKVTFFYHIFLTSSSFLLDTNVAFSISLCSDILLIQIHSNRQKNGNQRTSVGCRSEFCFSAFTFSVFLPLLFRVLRGFYCVVLGLNHCSDGFWWLLIVACLGTFVFTASFCWVLLMFQQAIVYAVIYPFSCSEANRVH